MASSEADQFRDLPHAKGAVAMGSVVGALAASSCCMLPLVLFIFGASGPWIGRLVRLAPYQLYFIISSISSPRRLLASAAAAGLYIAHRANARWPAAPGRRTSLRWAPLYWRRALVIAAIGFNFFAPLLNS